MIPLKAYKGRQLLLLLTVGAGVSLLVVLNILSYSDMHGRIEASPVEQVQQIINRLQSLTDTPFNGTLEDVPFLNGSLLFEGSSSRLHYALLRALMTINSFNSNRPLRVAAIGGSVTAGRQYNGSQYCEHLTDWLRTALEPLGSFATLKNSGMAATGSELFAFCTDELLDLSEVDILLVEFAINDALTAVYMPGYKERGRPLEEVIRLIWRRNPFIHIIVVNFMHPRLIHTEKGKFECVSVDNAEFLDVVRFYDISSISFRHVICNGQTSNAENLGQYLASDKNHPSALAHYQMGVFLVALFRKSFLMLQDHLRKVTLIDNYDSQVESFTESLKQSIETATRNHLKSQALFRSTWIDEVECFMSVDINGRRRDKLRKAMVNLERSRLKHNTVLPRIVYDNKNQPIEFQNYYDTFKLPSNPNGTMELSLEVSIRADALLKTCEGFLPRLAISYRTPRNVKFGGRYNFSVVFYFDDKSTHHLAFDVELLTSQFSVTYVHVIWPPPPEIKNVNFDLSPFCRYNQTAITKMTWQITWLGGELVTDISAVIIAYDCCLNSN